MTPLPPKPTEDEVERARALIQDIEAWGLGKAVTEPGVTHLSAMDRAAITLSAALLSRVAALQTERDEAVKAERERCAVLRVWLLDLSANESDLNEPVADNGATVWDHIRTDARRFAERLT